MMFQMKRMEEEVEEQHIIYAVGAEEHESCRVRSKRPRIVAYCTSPATHRWEIKLKLKLWGNAKKHLKAPSSPQDIEIFPLFFHPIVGFKCQSFLGPCQYHYSQSKLCQEDNCDTMELTRKSETLTSKY